MANKPSKEHIAEIKDVVFGENVTVVHPCNLYGCKIGSNCFIGPFTEIQKGAKIGDNTRVQTHAFICDKVTIGNDCFIGHGVMFINDTFSNLGRPAYTELEEWKETWVFVIRIDGKERKFRKSAADESANIEHCSHVLYDFDKVAIKAIAKDTLEVTLKSPTPYFIYLMQFYPTFPVNRKT